MVALIRFSGFLKTYSSYRGSIPILKTVKELKILIHHSCIQIYDNTLEMRVTSFEEEYEVVQLNLYTKIS